MIEFSVPCNDWHGALGNYEVIGSRAIEHAQAHLKLEPGKITTICLSDDAHICRLNKQYRGKDIPTNILSFPADDDEYYGDLILSFQVVHREALEKNISLEAHYMHLLVHGFLHLIGYDHITDEHGDEMEALEITILNDMNVANPYE